MDEPSEATQPLLGDIESQRDLEVEVTEQCSVTELLECRQMQVLRYIQEKGVSLLGEFEEEDNLVFPAFEDAELLTFGSGSQTVDYEAEWRRRLQEAGGKRVAQGGWSNKVAVEAYVVTIRNAAAPDSKGLLQPLLKRYQAKRCSYAVFALPAVQAVIKFKWFTYARHVLMLELFWFLIWLVSFNVFTIAFQDEDLSLTLGQLLKSTRGRVTVAAELLALVGMVPFLVLEAGTISAYGLGWLDMWNALDMLTYCTQIGATVCHLGRFWTKSELLTTLLAVQSILLVFRLQWFTQAFQGVRISYLPIIKKVWSDLRPAFYLMLLVMWGFATAFNIALRHDQDAQEEYSSIITSFLSMFEHQYGDMEFKPMWQSKSPKIATALAVAYTFVQGTIIINCLLGIVISSLDKATQHEGMKMLLNQARIIDEIESTLPSWIERRHPNWFPSYVHLLRIVPEKLDRVEQDALWTLMGRDEPQVLQSSSSSPLTDGHPRYVNGEMEEQGQGGAEGDTGSGSKEQEGEGHPSVSAGSTAGVLQEQVAAMQRQLEEQGCLLRRMCEQLALPPATAAGNIGEGGMAGS